MKKILCLSVLALTMNNTHGMISSFMNSKKMPSMSENFMVVKVDQSLYMAQLQEQKDMVNLYLFPESTVFVSRFEALSGNIEVFFENFLEKYVYQTYKENCENKKNEIVNSIKEIKKLLGEQSKDWKSVSNCLNDLIKLLEGAANCKDKNNNYYIFDTFTSWRDKIGDPHWRNLLLGYASEIKAGLRINESDKNKYLEKIIANDCFLKNQKSTIDEQKSIIDEKEKQLTTAQNTIDEQKSTIDEKEKQLTAARNTIDEQKSTIDKQNNQIMLFEKQFDEAEKRRAAEGSMFAGISQGFRLNIAAIKALWETNELTADDIQLIEKLAKKVLEEKSQQVQSSFSDIAKKINLPAIGYDGDEQSREIQLKAQSDDIDYLNAVLNVSLQIIALKKQAMERNSNGAVLADMTKDVNELRKFNDTEGNHIKYTGQWASWGLLNDGCVVVNQDAILRFDDKELIYKRRKKFNFEFNLDLAFYDKMLHIVPDSIVDGDDNLYVFGAIKDEQMLLLINPNWIAVGRYEETKYPQVKKYLPKIKVSGSWLVCDQNGSKEFGLGPEISLDQLPDQISKFVNYNAQPTVEEVEE